MGCCHSRCAHLSCLVGSVEVVVCGICRRNSKTAFVWVKSQLEVGDPGNEYTDIKAGRGTMLEDKRWEKDMTLITLYSTSYFMKPNGRQGWRDTQEAMQGTSTQSILGCTWMPRVQTSRSEKGSAERSWARCCRARQYCREQSGTCCKQEASAFPLPLLWQGIMETHPNNPRCVLCARSTSTPKDTEHHQQERRQKPAPEVTVRIGQRVGKMWQESSVEKAGFVQDRVITITEKGGSKRK
eukprot:3941113-Rhodomonas_salina.3